MKILFLVQFCFLELLTEGMSSKSKGKQKKLLKSQTFATSEKQQNKLLESISPEYSYKESDYSPLKDDDSISTLLDKQTMRELTTKHLLEASDSRHSTPTHRDGLGLALGRPTKESLEDLNVMLQNTLPEYRFDRAERGPGFSYDGCVDLDPDCRKYETDGLCSDSPDLAEKRFNCKKTCHLCVSG